MIVLDSLEFKAYIISPSGYMQGGWQKVDPDDNPFKDA